MSQEKNNYFRCGQSLFQLNSLYLIQYKVRRISQEKDCFSMESRAIDSIANAKHKCEPSNTNKIQIRLIPSFSYTIVQIIYIKKTLIFIQSAQLLEFVVRQIPRMTIDTVSNKRLKIFWILSKWISLYFVTRQATRNKLMLISNCEKIILLHNYRN